MEINHENGTVVLDNYEEIYSVPSSFSGFGIVRTKNYEQLSSSDAWDLIPDWDYLKDNAKSLLLGAYREAQKSVDKETHNGALLIDLHSKNQYMFKGHIDYISDKIHRMPERETRPKKYNFLEHAERNAVYNNMLHLTRSRNAAMVTPWYSCSDCARAIISTESITWILGHADFFKRYQSLCKRNHWTDTVKDGFDQLLEHGIYCTLWFGPLSDQTTHQKSHIVLCNEKEYDPTKSLENQNDS